MLPISERVERLAALSDPVRLAIVDRLTPSDRAPVELRRQLGIESNLLAHHLDVLEAAGLIERSRSSGDGRRRYVHLIPGSLGGLLAAPAPAATEALFVCSQNSARSQLAEVIWRDLAGTPASSAGTHPAESVHPGAVAAARRAGLDLGEATPRSLGEVGPAGTGADGTGRDGTGREALVITVCDRAHEELDPPEEWLHWSIPDPVPDGRPEAFDSVVAELRARVAAVLA